MKALLIGCVMSSECALETLLACDGIDIVGVVTRRASTFNADFRDLTPLCKQNGVPVFFADDTDTAEMTAWIARQAPDIAFCIGWSHLLDQDILDIPSHGVIGYHPAPLPRGRGRHPIIWALALGLEETGSSLFVMDAGADSGAIVTQQRVPITADDDAASLYARLLEILQSQLHDICQKLCTGSLSTHPQDHSAATYWRKRDKSDGRIDWRMPAEGIRNLVRALAAPYPGAHCLFDGEEIKVHKIETANAETDIEPGRVIGVIGGVITVKAGTDAVRLIEHGFTRLPATLDYLQ